MNDRPVAPRESREQAAASIAAALDFLQGEADSAGLPRVAELIRRASREATVGTNSPERPYSLPVACRAIIGLPEEYRSALIYRKVYRCTYEQIANDCGISAATAKHRVARGFQLVRASLRTNLPQ